MLEANRVCVCVLLRLWHVTRRHTKKKKKNEMIIRVHYGDDDSSESDDSRLDLFLSFY